VEILGVRPVKPRTVRARPEPEPVLPPEPSIVIANTGAMPAPTVTFVEPARPSALSEEQAMMVATLRAIALMLSVRFILLLCLIGGFVLAVIAATASSLAPLYVLIAYALLICLPVVWLDSHRGPR